MVTKVKDSNHQVLYEVSDGANSILVWSEKKVGRISVHKRTGMSFGVMLDVYNKRDAAIIHSLFRKLVIMIDIKGKGVITGD